MELRGYLWHRVEGWRQAGQVSLLGRGDTWQLLSGHPPLYTPADVLSSCRGPTSNAPFSGACHTRRNQLAGAVLYTSPGPGQGLLRAQPPGPPPNFLSYSSALNLIAFHARTTTTDSVLAAPNMPSHRTAAPSGDCDSAARPPDFVKEVEVTLPPDLMKEVSRRLPHPDFAALPPDLLKEVFCYLALPDLVRASSTCQAWRDAASSSEVGPRRSLKDIIRHATS